MHYRTMNKQEIRRKIRLDILCSIIRTGWIEQTILYGGFGYVKGYSFRIGVRTGSGRFTPILMKILPRQEGNEYIAKATKLCGGWIKLLEIYAGGNIIYNRLPYRDKDKSHIMMDLLVDDRVRGALFGSTGLPISEIRYQDHYNI